MLDTDVAIESPEHVVFRHRVAGPARRAVAYLVDLVLCYGVVLVIAVVVALAGADVESSVSRAGVGLLLLAVFIAQWIYFFAWEAARGTTPGKRALGLAVVTTEGRPIGARAAAVRNLIRAADALPTAYVAGLVTMALSRRFQRLGDLAAGTMVVRAARPWRAAPIKLTPGPSAAELARLAPRVALDADERAALELFLRRRGTLGRARELELAEIIAPGMRARFGGDAEPVRLLALLYERAVSEGREEMPASSRRAR